MDPEVLFPPDGLRVHAGPLTLRLLRDGDQRAYADLLDRPIFEDDQAADQVFPWYAAEPAQRLLGALQYHWGLRAAFAPSSWTLALGVFAGDDLVGQQDVGATDFAERRTVSSGSWLTRDAHGRGWGRLMRQAVLALAFDHLGAVRAESSAVLGNDRSLGVSRSCGYVLNGDQVVFEGGSARTLQRVLVTPETFRRPGEAVRVEGLTPTLRRLLGAEGVGVDDVAVDGAGADGD